MQATPSTNSPADTTTSASSISLDQAKRGQTLVLVSVEGGKRMQEKLISMGFPTGCSFRVQQNNRGAVVIGCDCNRLAIGANMAYKLVVRVVA